MKLTKNVIEMMADIIKEIKRLLHENLSEVTEAKIQKMYRIINPDINNYQIYGIRVATIDSIVKNVSINLACTYDHAVEVYKKLMESNIEEEKFAAFLFLNRFKKQFNHQTPSLIHDHLKSYCHTWSVLDSTCTRVLGPFLAKEENDGLAKQIINEWSYSNNIWIKRGAMVLLLKIIMVKKDFNKDYVADLVEKMLMYSNENYIEKAIGWLLKTCSKYRPDLIYNYLITNKKKFTRLILRYASEKLPKDKRAIILKK